MSLELDTFFNLQVNAVEDAPLQQSLLTTIRTPIEASNPNTNSVFIKIPKQGLLTSDSMVTFRLTAEQGLTNSCRVNLLNGALGAIKRFTLRVDNKILSDIERPSQFVTQALYSQNSVSKISCLHHYLFGCNTRLTVDQLDGIEHPDVRAGVVLTYDGFDIPTMTVQEFEISDTADSNYRFGVPLSFLGATWLANNNLPMFMMKDREVIMEIQFERDSREYVIGTSDTDVAYCVVDLPTVELVSTHIMQDEELERAMMAQIKKTPFKYPMLDTYLVKNIISGQQVGTEHLETYRINLQGRELHSMLLAFRDTVLPEYQAASTFKIWTANQGSDALGDEVWLLKMNGRNVFERPITSQALVYFLTQLYNKGSSPQVSKLQYTCDQNTVLNAAVNTDEFNSDLRGRCHWVGFDFENGNNAVFGGGIQQVAPLEIQYTITPRTATFPSQASTHEVLAYMSVSKLLTIGAGQVGISF
jgi:hypothetical protein